MPKGRGGELMEKWSTDALETYGVRNCEQGLLQHQPGAGHLQVHPTKRPDRHVDLKDLVDQLQARASSCPSCYASPTSCGTASANSNEAFQTAIKEFDYKGRYVCVYPIKVNQQRQVVEEILDFGKPYNFGIEAGSKPELLAVLALTNGGGKAAGKGGDEDGTPIICNGFQGRRVHQMAMLARKDRQADHSPSSRSSPSWS